MVDIINSLNAGSGIDIKALAKNLTETVRIPQQAAIDNQKTILTAKISSLGKIMSVVNTFNDAINSFGDPQTFHRSPSSSDPTKVALEFTDAKVATTFAGRIGVSRLASESSILFPPMTSLDAPLAGVDGNRTLTLKSGTADAPGSVLASIDLTSVKTLASLRDRINEIDGFSATIIQGGSPADPRYYLGVKGGSGSANTFHASVTTNLNGQETTATGSGFYLDGTELIKQGADAEISVDGLVINSSTNDFTDILPGVKIKALALTTTEVVLSSAYNTTALSDAMATLVSGFNLMLDNIKSETAFDLDPKKRGGLSNDASTRGLLNELRRFTTQAISGVGDSTHFLAEIGVKTNRDGSLQLDETAFAKVLKQNPEIVESVLASKRLISDSRLSIIATGGAQPGKYEIAKVGVGQWTLNNQPATLTTGKLTAQTATYANGLVIGLPPGVEIAAPVGYKTNLYFGKGLIERFSDMFKSLKDNQSSLQKLSTSTNKTLSNLSTTQTKLDAKMKVIEDRYLKQFSQMNSIVSEGQNTMSSLKTFIDSWTAGLKA